MVLCIDKNRNNWQRKGNLKYSGILFPEVFKSFYFSIHEAYFLFEKGKNILFLPKKERMFFQQLIREIKNKTAFLERNIISVKFTPETLLFITEAKMDYFFDKKMSENLWLHRSDSNFIDKHLHDLLDWKFSLENKVFYKKIKKPIHFYLINKNDKIIYNQLVAAEIINSLEIDFCFGKNQSLAISKKDVKKVIDNLKEKDITIISNNPDRKELIQIFLKEEK